jgi:hypothetical protein
MVQSFNKYCTDNSTIFEEAQCSSCIALGSINCAVNIRNITDTTFENVSK